MMGQMRNIVLIVIGKRIDDYVADLCVGYI